MPEAMKQLGKRHQIPVGLRRRLLLRENEVGLGERGGAEVAGQVRAAARTALGTRQALKVALHVPHHAQCTLRQLAHAAASGGRFRPPLACSCPLTRGKYRPERAAGRSRRCRWCGTGSVAP